MKTYHGSCFCGGVKFEADGDLADGTMRCNCRFCTKMRYWEMRLPDPVCLRILRGQALLAETPRSGEVNIDMHHLFCQCCGTPLWSLGNIAAMGGAFVQVCVSALDDVAVEEMMQAPIHFANGATDN